MNFPEEIRERVRNMAIRFVERTSQVDREKLNKLFYLADVEAYKQTAFTLTEQTYVARRFGPVPVVSNGNEDFFGLSSLFDTNEDKFFYLRQGVSFDNGEFSDQELEIIDSICDIYKDLTATELSNKTHEPEFAWLDVWNDGRGEGYEIPFEFYDSGLSSDEKQLRELRKADAEKIYNTFLKLRSKELVE